MNTVRIAAVEVHRVVEWVGPIRTVEEMFPDTPPEMWTEQLAPHHWVPATRAYRAAIQTWVLRSGGRTVLVDTGVGNDRDRPQVQTFDHLRSDFLHRLADAGVQPADVDVVINTHVHYDHVGWNTQLAGERWVPTFPNATYLVPQADYDYFRPENAETHVPGPHRRRESPLRRDPARLRDSIAPIADAGQLQTWSGEHRIDGQLRLEPAPGHTPGSSVVWLDAGDGAVFVGDLMHTPVQIARPDDACDFDLDATQARISRRTVLEAAARTGATIFPAHLAGHGAMNISQTATAQLEIDQWAPLPAV